MKSTILRLPPIFLLGTCLYADDLVWGGTWSGIWSGFGTSAYTAIDTTTGNNRLLIFCLDYNDEIAPPFAWTAAINPITPANVVNDSQFGGNYPMPGVTTTPRAFSTDEALPVTRSISAPAQTTPTPATWSRLALHQYTCRPGAQQYEYDDGFASCGVEPLGRVQEPERSTQSRDRHQRLRH